MIKLARPSACISSELAGVYEIEFYKANKHQNLHREKEALIELSNTNLSRDSVWQKRCLSVSVWLSHCLRLSACLPVVGDKIGNKYFKVIFWSEKLSKCKPYVVRAIFTPFQCHFSCHYNNIITTQYKKCIYRSSTIYWAEKNLGFNL